MRTMNRLRILFGIFICLLLVPLEGSPNPPATTNAPPLADTAFHVLALPGHFPDWLKASLAQKLQVVIDVQTYRTPEEAASLLVAPNAQVDLALVPDRIIPGLIAAKALRDLPAERGVKPDHLYLGHYLDRDNRFAWPYAWNLIAIAYNPHAVKIAPQHWADLAATDTVKRTFFLDPFVAKALDQKGQRWAEAKHEPVEKSDALEAMPLPEAATEAEAAYRVGNYGDLRRDLAAQPDWKYVLPEEGSIIVMDHLVLPASGTNPGSADRAIALLMAPANTARLDSENIAAVTQKEALPLVPPELARDPLLYPTPHLMNNSSFAKK